MTDTNTAPAQAAGVSIATADVSLEAPTPADAPVEVNPVPEKFRNEDGTMDQEKFLSSYAALEAAQSAPPEPSADPADAPVPEALAPPEVPTGDGLTEAISQWSDEYAKDGELSEDTYASILKDHNADKATVDRIIAGEKAIADAGAREIQDMVGGPQAYQDMLAWEIKTNGREAADKFASNLGGYIASNDQAAIKLSVEGMQARYKQATKTGWSPEITGKDRGGRDIEPFASLQEARDAQASAAYKSGDPDYQRTWDERYRLLKQMPAA
jgi:hypothetical protein